MLEQIRHCFYDISRLWPCPHGEKGSISSTRANAVDSRLGLLGPGSGQRRLAQNLIQDFASLSMRPRTLGSLMNEEGGTRAFGTRAARWRESIPRPLCSLHLEQFFAQLSQLGDSPRAGSCMARVVTRVTRLGRMCDSENAHRYWRRVSAANQQMVRSRYGKHLSP